ncbi:hypothetical protein [Photorhabdus antumapuensis]|uniref:hypothetical protein n=1 Tax=Photorhabdus antumapuensis TaxID=2862867 RepID=UPI001CEC239F|nr:hypothetical protein [Photorhabdus antumapuensis]MCA6221976.1 hypothetical protein [Photorhabdus antumapuensis]
MKQQQFYLAINRSVSPFIAIKHNQLFNSPRIFRQNILFNNIIVFNDNISDTENAADTKKPLQLHCLMANPRIAKKIAQSSDLIGYF